MSPGRSSKPSLLPPTSAFSANQAPVACPGPSAPVPAVSSILGLPVAQVFSALDTLSAASSHYVSTDDICTPMACVKIMLDYLPDDLWLAQDIKVLDPCCGNGNFAAYAQFKTSARNLYYNDINPHRLANLRALLSPPPANITTTNFLLDQRFGQFDLVMANPPYSGGGNKNQSLSNLFIEKAIDLLKPGGYLCFITPNNWMTYNQRNTTLHKLLTTGGFLVIDNDVKRFFPGVGSSFTVFVWRKGQGPVPTTVVNGYLCHDQQVVSLPPTLKFIPLYLSPVTVSLAQKLVSSTRNGFDYRCDLHNFTKKNLLSDTKTGHFQYRTIHTPRKTRFATFKQDIYAQWTIIVPLSTYYLPYIVTKANVTQSVGYLSFPTRAAAEAELLQLEKPEIKLLVHLTRYGNFNNIMVLRHLKFSGGYSLSKSEHQEVARLCGLMKY